MRVYATASDERPEQHQPRVFDLRRTAGELAGEELEHGCLRLAKDYHDYPDAPLEVLADAFPRLETAPPRSMPCWRRSHPTERQRR